MSSRRLATDASISIVDWSPAYAGDFDRLNREWLERLFSVEPLDAKVLGDPGKYIVDPGGVIVFALDGNEVLGTCALKVDAPGVYELTKMAVTTAAQGRGIGRLLIDAIIARFRALDGELMFLESERRLAPALRLYETSGFEHAERRRPSEYARSDVYMEWRDPAQAASP